MGGIGINGDITSNTGTIKISVGDSGNTGSNAGILNGIASGSFAGSDGINGNINNYGLIISSGGKGGGNNNSFSYQSGAGINGSLNNYLLSTVLTIGGISSIYTTAGYGFIGTIQNYGYIKTISTGDFTLYLINTSQNFLFGIINTCSGIPIISGTIINNGTIYGTGYTTCPTTPISTPMYITKDIYQNYLPVSAFSTTMLALLEAGGNYYVVSDDGTIGTTSSYQTVIKTQTGTGLPVVVFGTIYGQTNQPDTTIEPSILGSTNTFLFNDTTETDYRVVNAVSICSNIQAIPAIFTQ